MPRFDGSINIDTKIDTTGFEKGMSDVKRSATDAFGTVAGTVQDFDQAWQSMGWGEKQAIIGKALEELGNDFNHLGREAQMAIYEDIYLSMQEVPEAADEASDAIDDMKDSTDEAADSTKAWALQSSGLYRIIAALVPRAYRVRRAATGIAELSAAMKGAATAAAVVASGILAVTLAIGAALLVGVALFAAWFKWAQKTTEALYRNLSLTSDFRERVVELQRGFERVKGSMQALGATLLNAMAPAILKVIDLLVRMINFATLFIASLLGVETVMLYVSGAADEAASGVGGMADETERALGAAEGALAAFDELNVLAQAPETEAAATTGGGAAGGAITMEEVPVPEEFHKTAWDTFLEWLRGKWREIWTSIVTWVLNRMLDLIEWLPTMWTAIGDFVVRVLDWIKEKAGTVWDWIKEKVSSVWAAIVEFAKRRWKAFIDFYGGIVAWIINAVGRLRDRVVNKFWDMVERVKEIWASIKDWFRTKIWDPVSEGFMTFLDGIKEAFSEKFEGVKQIVKGVMNTIIRFLNAMIDGVVSGVNTAIRALNRLHVRIPSWVPFYGGKSWGMNLARISAPRIPELARGAVIPPNQPFAAVLGEQTAGKNIEAPESLIRDIIQEEMGQIKGDFNIEFGGSMGELVRVLKPYIDKEDVRVGDSLIERQTI